MPTETQTKQKSKTDDKSVKQSKQNTAASTQVHLKVAEIRDDTLVLKNGGLRAALKVNSINFNLKSDDEQNAIIYSYQNFLNSLEFPIQIVIRSKRLDIDNYLDSLNDLGEKQTNDLLQRQTYEYMDYIQRLVEYADIMEKSFYVIVPFNPYRSKKPSLIQRFFQSLSPKDTPIESNRRRREFIQLKKILNQRVTVVKAGLQGVGLQVDQLETKDLIELFYETYNPLSSRVQKFEDLEEINIKTDNDILDEESQEELGGDEEEGTSK
jgi:type IV secretory pathway VirB4 component